MGRWRRHVDPSVARGNWTLEEDEKLTKEHETLGAKWAVIAREIEGRTAQQCRARFYQLKQIQRDEEEEKKKKKKKKTVDGEENDENGENKNGNENRSFAQDPSKSITEPSTPEEEAEKPPTARTSRSTKKTTLPTLFSAATKRKPSSATAAPARSNAKGSTTKTAKPKTSRRRTPTNGGRRTVIKNDAFRGNQDDTLTLLCAAADRLEGLFSSTTQRHSF